MKNLISNKTTILAETIYKNEHDCFGLKKRVASYDHRSSYENVIHYDLITSILSSQNEKT